MKTIAVLVALTCLVGFANAQIIGLGEGYSSTQLAFFNSPGSSTFEPDVQQYWSSYIAQQQNQSIKSATSNMGIWMNTFPLNFETPLALTTTSFSGSVQAPILSAKEKNSQFLTRGVNGNFGINQIWSYPVTSGSLTVSNSTGTPSDNAKGKLLSQNIITLFGV
jgi:hypothetical protein